MRSILSRLVSAWPEAVGELSPEALTRAIDLMPNEKRLVVYHALKKFNLRTGKRKAPLPPRVDDLENEE